MRTGARFDRSTGDMPIRQPPGRIGGKRELVRRCLAVAALEPTAKIGRERFGIGLDRERLACRSPESVGSRVAHGEPATALWGDLGETAPMPGHRVLPFSLPKRRHEAIRDST